MIRRWYRSPHPSYPTVLVTYIFLGILVEWEFDMVVGPAAYRVHAAKPVAAQIHPGGVEHVGHDITQCSLQSGTTEEHQDFGNTFSETFNIGIGTGFTCVNVQLSGWRLDYLN